MAISDVVEWEGYEELLRKYRPDVVALAGDLVSDGFASFHSRAWDLVPQFRHSRRKLMKKFGIGGGGDVFRSTRASTDATFYARYDRFRVQLDSLKRKLESTTAFAKARWRLHVSKFYEFLKNAGKQASVLVVKGDHDNDFANDYRADEISCIPGCSEITGQCLTLSGMRFFGLGWDQTHYLRQMRKYLADYADQVEVVIAHSEQSAMPLLGALRPNLLIRGHFGSGKYLVNGAPSVFTADAHHTVIDLIPSSLPKITQYQTDRGKNFRTLHKGSCRPWFTTESEFDRYPWLAKYPG